MPAAQAQPVTLRQRRASVQDEALLFELFAADKRAELLACGVSTAHAEALVLMQYRGRQMTYRNQYPKAEDLIILDDDDEPAGRLLFDCDADCCRIVDIAVLPVHRGKGMATAAIMDCQLRCAERRTSLELVVSPANPARALYERLGFRATHVDEVAVQMIWNAEDQATK